MKITKTNNNELPINIDFGNGVELDFTILAIKELNKKLNELVGQIEPLVIQKPADKFRLLAQETYLELAEDLIQMAGVDKKKARETRLIMMKAGFDNEDLQIIPIIERALWKAYNSRFAV